MEKESCTARANGDFPLNTERPTGKRHRGDGGAGEQGHKGHTGQTDTQMKLTTIPHNHPDPQTHAHPQARLSARTSRKRTRHPGATSPVIQSVISRSHPALTPQPALNPAPPLPFNHKYHEPAPRGAAEPTDAHTEPRPRPTQKRPPPANPTLLPPAPRAPPRACSKAVGEMKAPWGRRARCRTRSVLAPAGCGRNPQ